MLSHVLTDRSSHSQTDVRVNVDLAYSQLSSLTQLIFRNADSIRHLAAVGVYDLYELLRNGGRTVQNDREARQTLDALFQYVETQRRRNQNAVLVASALLRSELVCAMGSTDSDCQRVTTGAGNEFLYFFRMGVALVARLNNNFVLDASQSAQLSLDNYAVVMCVLNNLLGQSDVFLERLGGSVDHNGGEAAVDAGLTNLERVAVIQMQSDRDIRVVDNCSLNHLYQIGVVCVSASALGYLQAFSSPAASVIP